MKDRIGNRNRDMLPAPRVFEARDHDPAQAVDREHQEPDQARKAPSRANDSEDFPSLSRHDPSLPQEE